jgi:hypothetical protein
MRRKMGASGAGGHTMKAWLEDIERARTDAELLEEARAYCVLVHPRDLAPLPVDCRAIRIDDAADIPRVTQRLAEVYAALKEQEIATPSLRDLVTYLSHATRRLGELHH